MSELVFARCQSHRFASPLGQGEKTEVRGSDLAGGISRFEQPSPFPSPLRRKRRPLVSAGVPSA
jgi:hypothetical protein